MNRFLALILITISTFTRAQNNPIAANSSGPSPAERSITEAQKKIKEKPEQNAGYNLLAAALVRRARETSDPNYYAQAQNALKKSFDLAPGNFEAEKIQVAILLGEHEYPAGLDLAIALNKKVPDDVMVYGLLTEANAELGNYKDAETAAQWMLNLRPGNLPALINAAHLRELFGDSEGSYELFQLAYESTAPTENEERAWLLTQMAHLRLASGNIDAAEKLLQQALTSFPNYDLAVGNLASVRVAQKRYEEAIALFQKRSQSLSGAGNLYELAHTLQLMGRESEERQTFAAFEAKALAESTKKNNSNYELIFYYADDAKQPSTALAIAEQEYAWRKDIYTLDAYAWALHVNGRDTEARQSIEAALAVGIQDARLFRHAGEIALKSGDTAAAEHYLKQSVGLNSPDSDKARVILARLAKTGRR
ncbi:MAG: tetratricopeptide repeat protein [Acidobacteriales bacterium]|nr:tetratricopeptide repeat protein [Terriglobales bacterium]